MSERERDGQDLEPLLAPLRRFLARLQRKLGALQGDLAEAERAPEVRRLGEALLSSLGRIRGRSPQVVVPDPADPDRMLEIELDPRITPQANAARLLKRAAKLERGQSVIAENIERARRDVQGLTWVLDRAESAAEPDAVLRADLDRWLGRLPWSLRARRQGAAQPASAAARARRAIPARLVPRRLVTREGWPVLIGRTNEGNDHLTHAMARPEDYWFHVHGASGSHVVLRRGKGKNEPSKATLEEVAAWTAFYSRARKAGKVPVIYTRKKYVRRPRKAPAGLAVCTQEKTLMVRPQEPPRSALADAEDRDRPE